MSEQAGQNICTSGNWFLRERRLLPFALCLRVLCQAQLRHQLVVLCCFRLHAAFA